MFFSSNGDPFECKYVLKIRDKVVHNNETLIKCDKPVDKYYFRYYFEEPYFIAAGEKFDLAVRLAKNWESHENICTYYYENGPADGDPANPHPGIFHLEYGSDTSNGTSVD